LLSSREFQHARADARFILADMQKRSKAKQLNFAARIALRCLSQNNNFS